MLKKRYASLQELRAASDRRLQSILQKTAASYMRMQETKTPFWNGEIY